MARHGQTAANVAGRFQGQDDTPLDETGIEQAHELAANAEGHEIQAIWCSPLARARQTADVVAEKLGLPVLPDPRFAEHDVGDWTGRLKKDIEQEEPERWAAYMRAGEEFRFPGGESLEEQMERVVDGLVAVTQAGELPALIICHRGVIRSARCHTESRGLDVFHDIEVPNGALIRL